MRNLFIFTLLFSLTACVSQDSLITSNVSYQNLNGSWQLEYTDNITNEPVTTWVDVPGNWLLSGVEHAGSAYYSHDFYLSDKLDTSRYWLQLDAVDYQSVVSLNNKYLVQHTGYFSPVETEITQVVREGDNQLSVWVNSPDEKKQPDWSLNKTVIKGVLNHHDTRPGGAWSDRGQEKNSGGIWGDVTLKQTGAVALKHLRFIPEVTDVDAKRTTAAVTLELDSRYQGQLELRLSLSDSSSQSSEEYVIPLDVQNGQRVFNWELPSQPRELWWPWDWGEPTLYELKVSAYIDGKESDQIKQRVGFRNFHFDENAGYFYVNGKPYFIRGTNYIASQWLGEVSTEDYRRDLALMKEANINGVRVHAHVAGVDMYELADEMGLIVWQDFPLQWGYNDSLSLQLEAAKQAVAMTQLLANHPSIAFWCAHNEPPWDATWMQYKYPTYKEKLNHGLTEQVYQALMSADDKRIVREASYTYEHPWLGWYSGSFRDYKTYQPSVIVSEFGAQAFPDIAMVEEIIGSDLQWPLSQAAVDNLQYHNYQPYETLELAKVSTGDSVAEFINNSQEYQRVVNKFAAEQLRLRKDQGVAAIYQFMFVDSWPAITWAILDVEREKKPAYESLKQAYQPVIAIAESNNNEAKDEISITLINDTLKDYVGLTLVIENEFDEKNWVFNGLKLLANQKVKPLKDEKLVGLSSHFQLSIIDKDGRLISKNRYLLQDL